MGSGTGGAVGVIISPKNGHGHSAINELGGHYVMTATTLTQAEGDDISTANDFREVGMVVDPTTYGTSTVASSTTARQSYVVKASSSSGTFEADEVITQASTGALGKVVEWDSTLSLLYYQQESYKGFGTNATNGGYVGFSGANLITGGTSGATGRIISATTPISYTLVNGVGATDFTTGETITGQFSGATASFSGNVDIGGVLTYEDVTNVDSIGVITARKGIVSSGVVTATAFHGDGSALTGIDATALKDSGGNVIGSATVLNGAVEVFEKNATDTLTASAGGASVKVVKIAFTR